MAKQNGSTVDPKTSADGMPDFSKFVETATGFPPYWKATEGAWFFGKVIGIDIRSGTFPRYTVIALMDLDCATGPADDAIPCKVAKGEKFSTNVWAGLPLDIFMGQEVRVRAIKKSKGGEGDMWKFKVDSTPEVKALVAGRKSMFEWLGGGKPTLADAIPPHVLGEGMNDEGYKVAKALLEQAATS